jgi:hypothetical protein
MAKKSSHATVPLIKIVPEEAVWKVPEMVGIEQEFLQ